MEKSKKIEDADSVATQLHVVRTNIATQKLLERSLTTKLLERLHEEQKNQAGDYKISKAISLKIVDPEKAQQWALPRNCIKVDTTKAKLIFRMNFENPEQYGFERTEQEKIIPIKSNNEDEV